MVTQRDRVLTFLFSDIVSSSELWEREPEHMATALELHDVRALEHITDAGGHIFKHAGDGFIAAFDSASGALDAAVAFMQRIQTDDWGGLTAPFKVRLGAHTGEATERDGDYFGRSVNRAARVMAAANGDQIVVSQGTAALCPDRQFEDQGVHELRGVGAERLLLLSDQALLHNPAPLRAVQATNLPVSTQAVVGRARDSIDIAERLSETRSVTLIGPGGVGKTTLALAVALKLAPNFPDGAWFCRLDKANTAESAAAVVAETVGAPSLPGASLAESIGKRLGNQKALVVLDNCEHVLDEARAIADEILSRSPESVVLATSRERLGRAGEQAFPIRPLDPVTDGFELLMVRARERAPDFALSSAEESAAIELCEHLDGLPLAIELAAARLTVLQPSAILARLTDRFRLLKGGRTNERQSSLFNTIQWSYELLDDRTCRFFDRLSVFRGGFTLEAAEAVCGDGFDEYEILDLIHLLVEKSMIQRGQDLGNDRFEILESLHQFGAQRLSETGQGPGIVAAHLRWFTDLAISEAGRLYTAHEMSARAMIDSEWDNLRVAFQRAIALGGLDAAADLIASVHYFSVIVLRFEGLAWSQEWLSHPAAAAHPRFEHVRAVASSHSYYLMDLERSRQIAVEGLDSDRDLAALPLIGIWTFVALGDQAGAKQFVEAWLERAQAAAADPFYDGMTASMAAIYHGTLCRDAQAADPYIKIGRRHAEASGAPSALAFADMVEGIALAALEPDRALRALARAEAAARRISDRHAYIDGAQTTFAQIMADDDDVTESLQRSSVAIESAARHHFLPRLAHDLQSAARALSRAGDTPTATLLIGATRAHGQGSWRRGMNTIADSAGPDRDRLLDDGERLTLYQAAEIAQDAIDKARASLA